MNEYFVYALIDPRDGSIFYIGKGKGNRPKQHLTESLRYKNNTEKAINPHKTRKILNILKAGYKSYTILYLHKNLTEKQAFELEKYEIANHSNLTNIGKGGDGGDNISNNPRYDEICKKISDGGKNRYKNPLERAKCARPGKQNGMYGRTHTLETRKRLSETHQGNYIQRFGEKRAEELKKKISQITKTRIESLGGQPWTREITDEQLYFIMISMEYGAYSWYLLEKRTGLTKKIIIRVCKQYNIPINVIKLKAGNLNEYYGEDAEIHRYNKSIVHRGKLNGRYKDGKQCKSYNNPNP